MPYRGSNYSFVIDSTFQPFSMQELLVPFTAYKDAYEKTEAAYDELVDKTDVFKYLSKTLPEGSKAREIYENYAKDLEESAKTLSSGLNLENRGALTNLRRRFKGEIGRLEQAKTSLDKINELRSAAALKDPTIMYATTPTIDTLLDNDSPNLYGVSNNALRARGAEAAKNISSRIFDNSDAGKALQGQYLLYKQSKGVNPAAMDEFIQSDAVQNHIRGILQEQGVLDNITNEKDLQRAYNSVLNGFVEGVVYEESIKPYENGEYIDAKSRASLAMEREKLEAAKAAAAAKAGAGSGSGSGSGSTRYPVYDKLTKRDSTGRGSVEYPEGVPSSAREVKVRKVNGEGYEMYVKNGKNELVLGKINNDGTVTKGEGVNADSFGEYFSRPKYRPDNWFNRTYDPKWDDQTIANLGQDILDIENREGADAFLNYKFYFEPDNAANDNHGGSIFIEPLKRDMGTVLNGIPGALMDEFVSDDIY